MAKFTRNLHIISRCTQTQRTQQLQALGVNGAQVPYLLRISRIPGMTQEELARSLCLNKSTVARQIACLEKAGFAERRPCPEDRRCLQIFPTQRTLDALPSIRRVIDEWNDYLLGDLTADERELLISMMSRVSDRAKAYIELEGGWDE